MGKGGDSVGSFFSSLQVSVEDHPMTDAAKTSECYLDGASNQVMGGCGPLSEPVFPGRDIRHVYKAAKTRNFVHGIILYGFMGERSNTSI